MTRFKVVKGCAVLAEIASGGFFAIAGYNFSEDTVFMSIYGLMAAFYCLSYAYFLRVIHLKGI